MFDIEQFVSECRAALREAAPAAAVREVVERAVSDPAAVSAAVARRPGVELLHRSDDLTVASVVVPPRTPRTLAHDHRMWAVVGVYGGQEDNEFFVRSDEGLAPRGGRSLLVSHTLAMGDDTIHAIRNPSTHDALAAIHVYGGDLVGTARSMWTEPDLREAPYDDEKVIGAPIRSA